MKGRAWGEVIEVRSEDSVYGVPGDWTHYRTLCPVIRYQLPDGSTITVFDSMGHPRWKNSEGRRVQIAYDLNDPRRIYSMDNDSHISASRFLLAFGIGFILFGLLACWILFCLS